MRGFVFIEGGKSVLLEKPFFALKVHLGEFDEALELQADGAAVGPVDEGDAHFVQRVHQNTVLIVHGFDADDALVAPLQQGHNYLRNQGQV